MIRIFYLQIQKIDKKNIEIVSYFSILPKFDEALFFLLGSVLTFLL